MHEKWKTMLPPRSYIIGTLAVFILFVVGFCIQNTEIVLPFKKEHSIGCSQKVAEKAIELEHCERKLLLKSENMSIQNTEIVLPFKKEHLINCSQKVAEKAIELKHCERKLLLKSENMSIQNTEIVLPFKKEHSIGCSQKVAEKAMELNHCERKLLLKSGNGRKMGLNVLSPWLAPIIWDGTYNINIMNQQHIGTRIGLFVFAVKKYIQFLLTFLESAERYFMVGHKVTYYAFTDKVNEVVKPKLADGRILQIHNVVADQRWQDVSMRRMEILTVFTKEHMPKEIDYLVCADVDMVFNDHVGVEILGDLVATLHPGFFLSEPEAFSYERGPNSAAYIPYGLGDFYYMAALYGGKVEEIYKLSVSCQKGIMKDKEKDIEAVWQEESHLNWYLVYNKPTKILSPEYLWAMNLPNGELIKKKRFLAVQKNHQEVRN